MPFPKLCFFSFFHAKPVKQADPNLAICKNCLQRRSSIKWFLTDENPLFPCPKPPTKTRECFRWTPSFWTAEIFAARYQLQSKCACTHTKVFSKPSVDIYCFPSPQLAVKHLIQQLWPRASSALRTLSATSLGQARGKTQQGTWMTCCGAFYIWDSHLIHLKAGYLQLLASSGSGKNSFSKSGLLLELIKLHLVIHTGKASHHTLLSSYITMAIITNLRRGWPVMHYAVPPPHGAALQCGIVQMSSVHSQIFDR